MAEGLLLGVGVRQANAFRLSASSARHRMMVGHSIAGEVCTKLTADHIKDGPTVQNAEREVCWRIRSGPRRSDAHRKRAD